MLAIIISSFMLALSKIPKDKLASGVLPSLVRVRLLRFVCCFIYLLLLSSDSEIVAFLVQLASFVGANILLQQNFKKQQRKDQRFLMPIVQRIWVS